MKKQFKFTVLKNFMWSIGIVLSLAAVSFGLLFSMFHKYTGSGGSLTPSLNASSAVSDEQLPAEAVSASGTQEDRSSDALGSGVSRGVLNTLSEVPDAGEGYISRLTFLVDSTFISLRDLSLVDSSSVWGTETGSMPMGSLSSTLIRFRDDSAISPASAAMIAKPEILVIGIGTDGLAKVDENTFITNYDALIADIRSASPDTLIICCGLPSVISGYTGQDGLGVTVISDGNDWVQLVCRDTGAYFLDVQEELSESVQLLSRYAASNGKTLNRAGLEAFLSYLRTHALQ